MIKRSFYLFIFLFVGEMFYLTASPKLVNVALPIWGTEVTASSEHAAVYAAYNLADGMHETGNSWFSKDYAPLPQSLTFTFKESYILTQINIYQSRWTGSMYHTKDFIVEGSKDGTIFETIDKGVLPDVSDAKWSKTIHHQSYRKIRIVITSSYSTIQTCGLGEVELVATVSEDKEPLYTQISKTIDWQTFRGKFRMSLELEPAAGLWVYHHRSDQSSPAGKYTSGPYEVTMTESAPDTLAQLISWDIRRTDNRPFKVLENNIECKTSYAGVYKLYHPQRMSQQNYFVDLPFRFNHITTVHDNHPVIWMQQTDGKNRFTIGLIDQNPKTVIEGSTYDPGNGGEAPGIANSYVRVNMKRMNPSNGTDIFTYSDALYINANSKVDWFEALRGYSRSVDAARQFKTAQISDWALNPMWHSWYAHADEINETLIRDDAQRAGLLGVKTIQIDAGWNIPKGEGYSFENEGDYSFSNRFPNAVGMIQDLHAAGQRVVLHVAPLLMGKNANAWMKMNDCLLRVNGMATPYLDPRLKKVQDYLLNSWEHLFTTYDIDGLWYDFLEFPLVVDAPPHGKEIISSDIFTAYSKLMQSLYDKATGLNPNAVIILRRPYANLNSKTFCTHVWPMDVPQDYNMNRRDVIFMKTFGEGVLTHACCTSWAISESDVNVARQMASITMAGVPAFSSILADSPPGHNRIIKAWLKFYDANKMELALGDVTPLLPTPPSAAIRIESEKKSFFGFFEAVPGLIEVSRKTNSVVIVNAFSHRTNTRMEGVQEGKWELRLFDQTLSPVDSTTIMTDGTGALDLNIHGPDACHTIVLTKKLSTGKKGFKNRK